MSFHVYMKSNPPPTPQAITKVWIQPYFSNVLIHVNPLNSFLLIKGLNEWWESKWTSEWHTAIKATSEMCFQSNHPPPSLSVKKANDFFLIQLFLFFFFAHEIFAFTWSDTDTVAAMMVLKKPSVSVFSPQRDVSSVTCDDGFVPSHYSPRQRCLSASSRCLFNDILCRGTSPIILSQGHFLAPPFIHLKEFYQRSRTICMM